jgi:ribonucleoside-diphosphate reductase beta chain
MFNEQPLRYTFHPIGDGRMYSYLKLIQKTFWFADEIDLKEDKAAFARLSKDEQGFLLHVLSFFASSDGLVNENLCMRVLPQVKTQESSAYYSFQMAIEAVHNETYSLLIDTYAPNLKVKDMMLESEQLIPSIKAKIEWGKRWIDEGSFSECIAAFCIVEGIFFSGSFASIYWLDERKSMLKGLFQANKFIARDEALHTEVAAYAYTHCEPVPKADLIRMLKDACEIEIDFVNEGLKVDLIGMNKSSMETYIKFITNNVANKLGVGTIYEGVSNPFNWLDKLAMANMGNFFEVKDGQYNKAGRDGEFNLNEDY